MSFETFNDFLNSPFGITFFLMCLCWAVAGIAFAYAQFQQGKLHKKWKSESLEDDDPQQYSADWWKRDGNERTKP